MARQPLTRVLVSALLIAWGFLPTGCASGGTPDGSSEAPQPTAAETGANPAETAQEPAANPQTPADAEPTASVGGIFTDDQAGRGRTTFDEVCSECHTTSEFRGRSFQRNWGRRTVYSFFRTVRSTMPDDNPGGLEEQVYLDVVSYILSINGHDGGSAELSPDSPMREVRIAPPESGR